MAYNPAEFNLKIKVIVLAEKSRTQTEYFVDPQSVVRQIWGKGDTILFIFAGAAAEFALNKAVDWLYFTGRLPADPLGRLFSTVSYARQIVFADRQTALKAIDSINAIHTNVEARRGQNIPDWAYRDVLFMLIDYSIRAYELLERELSTAEKEEVFDVFNRVGLLMEIPDLPKNYTEWQNRRAQHLQTDLHYSNFTRDLYSQYRKHLGPVRHALLLETQNLLVPQKVRELLGYRRRSFLSPAIWIYKLSRKLKLDELIRSVLLPNEYKQEIKSLDVATT